MSFSATPAGLRSRLRPGSSGIGRSGRVATRRTSGVLSTGRLGVGLAGADDLLLVRLPLGVGLVVLALPFGALLVEALFPLAGLGVEALGADVGRRLSS